MGWPVCAGGVVVARVRSRSVGAGEVPAELLSKSHRVWQSETATRKWLSAHGLEWHPRMDAGPLNRHERAAIAWAGAEGWSRTMPGGHEWPDWLRLRESGVPAWGGAELSEWMRHEGISIG